MAYAKSAPAAQPRLFDTATVPGGYTWWYADGLSRDASQGFTLIAFVGSVFSPYYAWSGRADPENHCAINLALYGHNHPRWTMTERGRGDLETDSMSLRIGPSMLRWDRGTLIIDIAEHSAPVPLPVRGQIRLKPRALNHDVFRIDTPGAHLWQPIAPSAEVELDFSSPGMRWTGDGYLDTNRGTAPLEQAFRYWDWSRVQSPDGRTAVLYNTLERGHAEQNLALLFRPDGGYERFDPPPKARLKSTPVFRVGRTTRASGEASVRLRRTLEDTPFYSRSIIESDLLGARAVGVHESFDGDRLKSAIVKLMLPFRMPRRPLRR
jgi:carotenoid 1,2-hydratase